MDSKDLMAFIAFVGVVMVPVLALTARFAMKPIVESIVQMRKAFADAPKAVPVDNEQIRLLQQEVADLRHAVEHLRDVVEFERALKTPASQPQLTATSVSDAERKR